MCLVPDEVVFCDQFSPDGEKLTYGDIRAKNDDDRLAYLQKRIDGWLLDQCSAIPRTSPFPLLIATLVGISSVSEIFYADKFSGGDNKTDKERFVHFSGKMDQRLTRKPSKDFSKTFSKKWKVEKPKTAADVLYTFLRNPLLHAWHGKAVFISADETPDIELRDAGYLVLNPFWLYDRFSTTTVDHCRQATAKKPSEVVRRNALKYLEYLLE